MSGSEWIYFGSDPKCGHVVAAIVDVADDKAHTSRVVAGYVRSGYDVSRRPNGDGIVWCNEDCPRMKEVRAAQALREGRRRKRTKAAQGVQLHFVGKGR